LVVTISFQATGDINPVGSPSMAFIKWMISTLPLQGSFTIRTFVG